MPNRLRGIGTVGISAVLLTLVLFMVLPYSAVHAEVSIGQISPSEGPVGTIVSVSGQITTNNGSYSILFDGEPVKNGTSVFTNVSDTFLVGNATAGTYEVKLLDALNGTESPALNFIVQREYIVRAATPRWPAQLQEGANVSIHALITGGTANETLTHGRIIVEDPANRTYSSNEFIIEGGSSGFGSISRIYPSEFNGGNHTTLYAGVYTLTLKSGNETIATSSFTIGLTDTVEYHRFQTVNISALNYTSGEGTVEITHSGATVFEATPNASNGIITANWTIPANASLGVYTVTVQQDSTQKAVPDAQNFTVASKSFACEVRALNLDNEPIEGVQIETNNLTDPVGSAVVTDAEGIASLQLEATNYTFVAFWAASPALPAQVGESSWISLSENITGIRAVNVSCSVAHIKVAVRDTKGGALPFVEVKINFTYVGRLDYNITDSISIDTDPDGISVFQNLFTNVSYTVEAIRYGHTFDQATLNLTQTTWINLTSAEYQLIITVYDRTGSPMRNAQVKIYERSIGLGSLALTDDTGTSGQVTFNSAFGEYVVNVYKADLLVNSTLVLLKEQPTTLTVHCSLYSLALDVRVVDYLGLGIPNANVGLEREGTMLSSANTRGDGVVTFVELVGGKYKIRISIGGQQMQITSINLQEPTSVTARIDGLVSVAGWAMGTSQFLTLILILLTMAIALGVLFYRRLRSRTRE